MKYLKYIKYWPFTIWAILAWILTEATVGFSYEGGIEGIIIITMGLWSIMFHLPNEYLYQFDLTSEQQDIIVTIIGFSIALSLDLILFLFRKLKIQLLVNALTIVVGAFPMIYYYLYKISFLRCFYGTNSWGRKITRTWNESWNCYFKEIFEGLAFPHYLVFIAFILLSVFLFRKKVPFYIYILSYVLFYTIIIVGFWVLVSIFSFA